MKLTSKIMLMIICLLLLCTPSCFSAEPSWVWFYADEYVSDYYDPNSLKVIRDYKGNIDHVEIWTRSTYSQAGAEQIIKNYNFKNIPKIYELDSSLTKIYIYPSKRKILYQNEVFYDKSRATLWAEEKSSYLTGVEVVPYSVNERYFSIITDIAFHNGQQIDFEKWKRNNPMDRLVYIEEIEKPDSSVEHYLLDTLLMTLNNDQVACWVLSETYLDKGIAKMYVRYTVDLSKSKIRIDRISEWTKEDGCVIDNEAFNGAWMSLIPGSSGEHMFEIMKKYVDEHRDEIIANMHLK